MTPLVGARFPSAFATALRQAGVPVSTRSVLLFADALDAVDLSRRSDLFWAARAALAIRPDDRDRFERVFDAFFGGPAALDHLDPDGDEPEPTPVTLVADVPGGEPVCASDDRPVDALGFSSREVLSHKDFARCTAAEAAELARLVDRVRADTPRRRSRRRRTVTGRIGRFDLPATAALALQTAGEPLRVGRTVTGSRPRRVVLLLDVSGSMDPYSRALLRFSHAMALGRREVEVFALGTRLTRVSRELRSHDPDAALARAAAEIADHGGGTRLGETLQEFNDTWGIRGVARGAIVVVCSDGWDRGDPALLGEQVERLSRVTHRLVWVNPLKASDGYAPLAGGMAAALPHVDDFIAGNSLAALEDLAELIAS